MNVWPWRDSRSRTYGPACGSYPTEMLKATPLGRHGQPDDIAKVDVFLASEDSARVTGEAIRVSRGLH